MFQNVPTGLEVGRVVGLESGERRGMKYKVGDDLDEDEGIYLVRRSERSGTEYGRGSVFHGRKRGCTLN